MIKHITDLPAGTKVRIERCEGSWYTNAEWWPASGMTGTIEKTYKNGAVRVAIDQIRNSSKDGKQSRNFSADDVFLVAIA